MRPFAASLVCAALLASAGRAAAAGHVFEIGTGWQNTGATRELTWEPAVQGSRKDVPAFVGWRLVGERRVYWAPSVRLSYTNFWSLGGAGNLLGVTLAPAAFGVYLTPPPARFTPAQRLHRWFAAIEIGVSLQLGGNVTPDSPGDDRVPDAEAHRAKLREEVAQGGVKSGFTQHYPLGSYSFVQLGLPTQIRAFNMVRDRVGVGFFFELDPMLLEWSLDRAGGNVANGYRFGGGIQITAF
jgi:hypothetical protein